MQLRFNKKPRKSDHGSVAWCELCALFKPFVMCSVILRLMSRTTRKSRGRRMQLDPRRPALHPHFLHSARLLLAVAIHYHVVHWGVHLRIFPHAVRGRSECLCAVAHFTTDRSNNRANLECGGREAWEAGFECRRRRHRSRSGRGSVCGISCETETMTSKLILIHHYYHPFMR